MRPTPEHSFGRTTCRRPGAAVAAALSLLFFASSAVNAKPPSAAPVTVDSGRALEEAVRGADAGAVIVIADGTWKDERIEIEGNGAAGAPITVRAQTPGKVVLTGKSSIEVRGSHVVVEGLHFRDGWLDSDHGHVVRLHGSNHTLRQTLIDKYNPPDRETRYFWVSLRGEHHTVEENTFRGMDHSGVTVVVWRDGSPDHHTIRRNHFETRPRGTGNGWETIRIGTSNESLSDSHTIVEENLLERCNGEGEIISSKSGKNIYRYNTFVECQGALTLRHGNGSLVEGNFFFGNNERSTGGVRVIGEDHRIINNYFFELAGDGTRSALTMMQGIVDSPLHGYYQVKRATVAFNTFIHCQNTLNIGQSGGQASLPPEDSLIANNIFVSAGRALIRHGLEPKNLTYQGNLGWGGPLGVPEQEGFRLVNPRLAHGFDDLWRPTDKSPVIGAASGDFKFITQDIEGRVRGSDKDIGAVSFSIDPPKRRPLKADDVGPAWLRSHPGE